MTNNEAAKWIQLYIDLAKIDPTTGEAAYLNDDARKTIEAMEMAINALTSQPETHDKRTEMHSCDCVLRQDALDAVADLYWMDERLLNFKKEIDATFDKIKTLPSAQPDIIVCADCKHWVCHDRRCGYWNHGVKPLEWCCHAERRTDECTD